MPFTASRNRCTSSLRCAACPADGSQPARSLATVSACSGAEVVDAERHLRAHSSRAALRASIHSLHHRE
jgi:hypothetical protein